LRNPQVIQKIGEIIVAPRGNSMRPFITPKQLLSLQEHFRPHNADTHTFLPPQEEEMTCPQLARALGVHDMTVRRAIAALNQEKSEGEDNLIGTTRKEQGRRPTVYYSSEQQARILAKLQEKGHSVPAKLRDKLGEDLTHKN
jgi:HTH domain